MMASTLKFSVSRWFRGIVGARAPASDSLGVCAPSAIPDEWEGAESDPEQTARALIQVGNATGLRRLLAGCSVDWARLDRHGRSLLTLAVTAGQLECVQALLNGGADIEKHVHGPQPLLSTAVIQGHINIVNFFICLGLDLEALGRHRRTALHCAASLGRPDCLAALVAAGADLMALDEFGATPFDMAIAGKHVGTAEYLSAAEVARDEKRLLAQTLGKFPRGGAGRL